MSNLLNGIRVLNIASLTLFLICCYYICVNSEKSPGALTVVHTDTEDENGIKIEDEDSETEVSSDPMNVFYPEKEWKTVKPGQAIPAGLHVRLNMENGQKEAKLMDGDDGNKYWKLGDKEGMVNTDSKTYTPEEIKEALKEFKATKHDIPDEKKAEEIRQKFRSYDELKKDFQKINMGIKTGQEIVSDLYDKLKLGNITSEEKESVLQELEYHLHQIDNAILFSDLGGIPLLLKGLNDTEPELRSLSAYTLGSAVQNNPKAKISAVESGALHHLVRSLATDPSIPVKKKTLFALSSLLRHFPFAQKKFFDLGGLQSMMMLFQDNMLHSLQVKVVTLMSDIYDERVHTLSHLDPVDDKYKQYEQVPLKSTLQDQGFCHILEPLLAIPDHDSREKVVVAMLSLYDCCKDMFLSSVAYLTKLEKEYLELSKAEDDGDYFTQIHKSLNTLVGQMSQVNKKEEL